MCTLVAIFGVNPEIPLIVGANRDEFYARPWAPPALLAESPRIFGGRDLTQGGTWLGVTESGFFAAVTNQRTFVPADPSKRSRGQLVKDALVAGGPEQVCALLAREDGRAYNPFNLLFGDARTLHVAYARDDARIQVESLPSGIWVLNNDSIGSRDFPKANRARALLTGEADAPWPQLSKRMVQVLGDHELPTADELRLPPDTPLPHELLRALQAQCVHTPTYGTTSSTLLALGADRVIDYRFAGGAPCTTPFVPVAL